MSVIDHRHFFVGGQWVAPIEAREPIVVSNSVTEEALETVPAGTPADVDAAVRAAHKALPGWMALSVSERGAWLRRLNEGLLRRVDSIAPLISLEVGMPIEGSKGYQTIRGSNFLSVFADVAETIAFEEAMGGSLIVREAVGVVGAITPSNFPLLLSINKIGAALVAGCTVVLKPPETAPGSLFILAEVAEEIGLPPGVLNLVTGYGKDVGEALATHPLVDMISFTGSTGVGRRLLELGAQTIKRAHMELGGKSAAVVLDDAALEPALTTILDQAFINAGQICFAWSRIVVPRSKLAACEEILGAAVDRLQVGNPLDPATSMGPIVTETARQRVRGYIDGAVSDGARLVRGGSDAPAHLNRGFFVRPTVLSGVTSDMRIAQDEVFGPVVSVIAHDGDDEAVTIANDTIFGLHGAVFSADHERAMAVARRVRTGQIDINGFKLGDNPTAPFGGFKQSGLGREHGTMGINEYLEVKSIQR